MQCPPWVGAPLQHPLDTDAEIGRRRSSASRTPTDLRAGTARASERTPASKTSGTAGRASPRWRESAIGSHRLAPRSDTATGAVRAPWSGILAVGYTPAGEIDSGLQRALWGSGGHSILTGTPRCQVSRGNDREFRGGASHMTYFLTPLAYLYITGDPDIVVLELLKDADA